MDLTKIALPTFVLEPRSLLERITDFFAHPDLIFGWVGVLWNKNVPVAMPIQKRLADWFAAPHPENPAMSSSVSWM
jgi:hypothetical protein